MSRPRRLSQAISEGDGISVLAAVRDLDSARLAEAQGAEGIVVGAPLPGVRDATALPILWRSSGPLREALGAGADACALVAEELAEDGDRLEQLHAEALSLGLDCVVDVRNEDELELALERVDPEILLLSGREADEEDGVLDRVLDLLPDVPAGKLAIAEAAVTSRDEVVALERAGIDAVIVRGANVAELVGGPPPEV